MKVLVVTLMCAVASGVAGGSIAWPGAIHYSAPVALAGHHNVIPGETKTSAYSTTQYLNALPAGSYSFGIPQFAVPVQHATGFTSAPGYYPIAGSPFAPATNVFYPAQPGFSGIFAPGVGLSPVAPFQPSTPTFQGESSDQQTGDADSAVIESADSFSPETQRQERPMGADTPSSQPPQSQGSSQPSQPRFPPATTFPNFPAIPQAPQGSNPQDVPPQDIPQAPQTPGFPQTPQIPQGSLPQNPQNTPQPPQFPGFPQFPQVPMPENPQDSSSQPQFPQNLPQFPGFPQFPQGSSPLPSLPQIPGFPQLPSNLFPQNPQGPSQSPPSNFPGAINSDKGLNDEDTISVESA